MLRQITSLCLNKIHPFIALFLLFLTKIKSMFLQGDRKQKVGVVDAEYIVHLGVPSLGGSNHVSIVSDTLLVLILILILI